MILHGCIEPQGLCLPEAQDPTQSCSEQGESIHSSHSFFLYSTFHSFLPDLICLYVSFCTLKFPLFSLLDLFLSSFPMDFSIM